MSTLKDKQNLDRKPMEESKPVVALAKETPPIIETKSIPPEVMIEVGEIPKQTPQEDEGFLDETIENLKQKLRGSKKKPNKIPQVKDDITVKIEKIMEQDLGDAFSELTPLQQQEFKIKGEETAWEVRKLLKSAHIKLKTIFKLILDWLKMLPGINRFFLEQEAKIKTDKIIALKERYKN